MAGGEAKEESDEARIEAKAKLLEAKRHDDELNAKLDENIKNLTEMAKKPRQPILQVTLHDDDSIQESETPLVG